MTPQIEFVREAFVVRACGFVTAYISSAISGDKAGRLMNPGCWTRWAAFDQTVGSGTNSRTA